MRILRIMLISLAAAAVTAAAAGAGAYYYLTRDLPSVAGLKEYQPNLVTRVYSHDGQVIGEFYIERRTVVSLNSMPDHLIKAFLAAEDAHFYEHEGIDVMGILRALYVNLKAGKVVQGGSTITQQVAKSFFLTPKRTIARKIREAVMAYRIEKYLTKDEILHLYLNQIYFGNGAYGVQAAAETYFDKDVEDLTLAESALLAGLPKAPSRYSPHVNPELAKKRQKFILARMLEEGFITRETGERAFKEPLKFKSRRARNLWVGPYFTEHVRRYIEERYGEELLYKGGLNVYTTLDTEMQRAANRAVDYGLRAHDKRRGYRGPVAKLTSKEAVDEFVAETARKLGGRPLEVGRIYRGVITAVDPKSKALYVDVGGRRGVVSRRDYRWARLYNPTEDPDGGKVVDPTGLFHPGDVIDVEVKALPEGDDAVPMRLEQEPQAQAALLAMEPETGYVKAMVGGFDFAKSQFNRAVQARRQPGSAFKPIIYAAALDKGYTTASIVMDSPIIFEEPTERLVEDAMESETDAETASEEVEVWRPRNYEKRFHGPTTIREALTKSRNIVTIKVLRDIGINYAVRYARRLGIESPLNKDLSLSLGSSSVSLLEMTRAFATFANLGWRPEPIFVTKVTDRYGNVLEEKIPSSESVLSPQTSYIMTNLLEGVIQNGTGWRARALKRPAAGKTGTTNNLNDAWFIGYVPDLVAGAWIGYDDEKRLGRHETGSRAALPIWLKFMKAALEGVPEKNFRIPDGVEFAKVDPKTGLLANPTTDGPVFEVFKVGTAPKEVSPAKGVAARSNDFFKMDVTDERSSLDERFDLLDVPEEPEEDRL
ncbi:MAG TPA: PBP1A family penicillin-binding protein [Deltaproteobacteria bacterium]|nr:PBP1A family penicillin-binding protein [Deltaproteobacteria bacterium]